MIHNNQHNVTSQPLHTSTNNHQPPSHSWKCNAKKLYISLSHLHWSNILELKTNKQKNNSKASESPYLRFHVSQFARLLGRLGQKVGAHFQHGRRVVVHGALLQLSHLGLHALLDVVLDLRNTARGRGRLTGLMRKEKKSLNPRTVHCSAKFSWRTSCDCTPYININKPAHAQQYNCVTQLPLPPPK